ncbi:MAG: hypothetical protein QXE64_02570 [Candidatus Pacearchaeota archaeon]
MKKKLAFVLLIMLALIILIIFALIISSFVFKIGKQTSASQSQEAEMQKETQEEMQEMQETLREKKFCETDSDCACGVDRETKQCAYGNKVYIDTSMQCQDFCTGIHGAFKLKCINNLCTMVLG